MHSEHRQKVESPCAGRQGEGQEWGAAVLLHTEPCKAFVPLPPGATTEGALPRGLTDAKHRPPRPCLSGCQGSQTSTACTGERWSKTLFGSIVCRTYNYSLLQRQEGGKLHYGRVMQYVVGLKFPFTSVLICWLETELAISEKETAIPGTKEVQQFLGITTSKRLSSIWA